MSSTDLDGILAGHLNLQSQLDKIKNSTSSRKVQNIINSNQNIVKGAGSPIKSEIDYQEVIKVRDSNIKLKRLNNSITQLSESRKEISTISKNFEHAEKNLLEIKNIVESAIEANPENTDQQEILNQLIKDLDSIARNSEINGRKVFDGNLNLTIPTGDQTGVSLDLSFNPDVVYDLEAINKITQINAGDFDRFGEEIVSNDKYLVIGARDALSSGIDTFFGKSKPKRLKADEEFKDGVIQILNKETGETFRLGTLKLASELGKDASYLRNIQFGDSLSINGDKLVIGASRIDGQAAEYDETSTEGKAFIMDLSKLRNAFGFSYIEGTAGKNGFFELENNNVKGDSFFGKDVAIKDGKAYVSTFNGIGSSISVFDAKNGKLLHEIEAPEESVSFGYELEVTDDKLFVSGYVDDGTVSGTEVGAVYIYDTKNLNADPTELRSPLEAQGNQFGNTVAAYQNIAAIGEHKAGQGANIVSSGAVHLYDTSTGELIQSLTPTSTILDSGDEFGSKISINEKFIAVSAAGDDDEGQDAGAVYIFDKASGIELAKITNSETKGFASSLNLDGDKIFIGATEDSNNNKINAGAVFEYDLSSLEVSKSNSATDPEESVLEASINISTEDLAIADLNSISAGNTESAEKVIKEVESILAGLNSFKGNVESAAKQLNNKITKLEIKRSAMLEKNASINQDFEDNKALQNEREYSKAFTKREPESAVKSQGNLIDKNSTFQLLTGVL